MPAPPACPGRGRARRRQRRRRPALDRGRRAVDALGRGVALLRRRRRPGRLLRFLPRRVHHRRPGRPDGNRRLRRRLQLVLLALAAHLRTRRRIADRPRLVVDLGEQPRQPEGPAVRLHEGPDARPDDGGGTRLVGRHHLPRAHAEVRSRRFQGLLRLDRLRVRWRQADREQHRRLGPAQQPHPAAARRHDLPVRPAGDRARPGLVRPARAGNRLESGHPGRTQRLDAVPQGCQLRRADRLRRPSIPGRGRPPSTAATSSPA